MTDLESMNTDVVADIVSRLDGLTLASFASTSSYLRPIALHPSLWRKLCLSTWPSTAHYHPMSFHQLFADSFPLLFYDEAEAVATTPLHPPTSPCDFVSFVDVFYKNQCVFSTVVHGIPEVSDASTSKLTDTHHTKVISDERWKWFLNCPFELQLLHLAHDDDKDEDEEEEDEDGYPETATELNNMELMKDLRLSWILLDNKTGKSVNLSTWKPISVQSVWPHKEDYIIHFGSIIPVEESMLPDKLARINITTKFKLREKDGCLQWREISMGIDDIQGALADGRTSLMILNTALYSLRTMNQLKVENGFDHYERKKAEMNRKSKLGETVANGMYICIQFAVFAILCNALIR
ncbi:F-box family protein [Euphorbia peplus]|nr:F-box family protein [Euphorbia peplus]